MPHRVGRNRPRSQGELPASGFDPITIQGTGDTTAGPNRDLYNTFTRPGPTPARTVPKSAPACSHRAVAWYSGCRAQGAAQRRMSSRAGKRVKGECHRLALTERYMSQVNAKCFTPRAASLKFALASVMFVLAVPAAAPAYTAAALRDEDVRKAERVIAKLRRLEVVTAAADVRAYEAEMMRLYPGLFADASELHESGLKADLTTAVFLYESAYRNGFNLRAGGADCGGEVRETYRKLCRETQGTDSPGLLWSKARLHTRWGEAVVRSHRGATDRETLRELSEIEAERAVDVILAERAVTSLKALAGRVGAFSSEEAFGYSSAGGKLSYEQLSEECSEALSALDRIVASLPRARLRLLLDNARSSYRDGLYWWGKTRRLRERTISVKDLSDADPLKAIGLPASAVNGTALANWRSALKYTRAAEKAIGALKA